MMKSNRLLFAGLALSALATVTLGQEKKPPSPPADTSVTINGKTITIKYSAPSMRGRKIFGELVPAGQVWRLGANAATALTTEGDLNIGGTKVPAGKYTLYAIPDVSQWQLIINKQTGQPGTEYSQDQDLARIKVKTTKADAPLETFKITLESAGGNKGTLTLAWENTVASVPFTVE
ncbi:MAG: DUF2911 domain-containing protein [Bryobacteraceae bacterium]